LDLTETWSGSKQYDNALTVCGQADRDHFGWRRELDGMFGKGADLPWKEVGDIGIPVVEERYCPRHDTGASG
jgi:hypothetical protein